MFNLYLVDEVNNARCICKQSSTADNIMAVGHFVQLTPNENC